MQGDRALSADSSHAGAVSLAYLSVLCSLCVLSMLVVAVLITWALTEWLGWRSPLPLMFWSLLAFASIALALLVALRQLRAAASVHTGTLGFHVASVIAALSIALTVPNAPETDLYLAELYYVLRILIEMLILMFLLTYFVLAWIARVPFKPIHLLGPVVSLFSIAWLILNFPG